MKSQLLFVISIISLLFIPVNLSAQSTSNRGTDFWLAYTGHVDGLVSRMTLFLSSDVNTTYEVKSGGKVISSGSISANVVTPVFINPNQHSVYIGSSNFKEVDKGINVTSAKPISLYCVISNNARTGSTLVLPTASLEQEYYVFSEQNKGNSSATVYSQFAIVGIKDGTLIDITPTQSSSDGKRPANVKYQIVGEDEADLKLGLINIGSPIARALIGKEEGDSAEVQAPGGVRRYEIIAVSYI